MRAFHLSSPGSRENLELRERDVPTPGPSEVLVRVHASSVNRRDLMLLHGTYPFPARPDVVPLSDGAGQVVERGSRVTRAAVGDRVAGTYFPRWADGRLTPDLARDQLGCAHDGLLAEYATLDAEWLVTVPDHLTWVQAACLPCAGVTAWSALTGPRPILPGRPCSSSAAARWRSSRCSSRGRSEHGWSP